MDIIVKQPAEKYSISIDFTGRLPTAITVSSGTLSAINQTTMQEDTNVYVSSSLSTTTTTASTTIQNGNDGTNYLLTFTVTLSDGSILQEDVLLKVRRARP
jgi:hypothetical protein